MSGGITITEDGFGVNGQGNPVKRYTLKNNNGFCVQVINYGATVTSINLPLKNGKTIDVVLGYDNMQGYLTKDNPYFGSTVGRVANRTKPTKFQLNGKPVCISGNLDENTQLHGGFKGFDKIMWDAKIEGSELVMRYCSPDGEEGFPGNLGVTIKFLITADNILKIIFTAVTDKTTIVNLTNHSYFNLAGHNAGADELLKHVLKVEADCYTKLENLVATGELVPVNGTGYDLRTPRPVGDAIKNISEDGFDINYVLKPANNSLKFAAGACYQPLGVTMDVYTTAPGVQLYTSNAIDKIIGKGGSCYKKHSAFCYETQHFPNSANIKSFPSIQLEPGAQYKHEVEYRFKF